MSCRDFVAFLMDYLAGELPPGERARFEAHLAECEDCVAYLRTYDRVVRLGREALRHPDDRPPEDVPEQLVQAVLAARRRP